MTDSTNADCPLATIGLPVYNGGAHLAAALRALVAQDYPNIEILISDNASTDETAEICRQAAQASPRVRYQRNAANVGPIRNFNLVLQRAAGKYFMWAAHDDSWNEHFVSQLVARLRAEPTAVLATPTILHIAEDGQLRPDPPDRPAPGESNLGNFKRLLDDHAPSWIYGVWNTAWLRRHIGELDRYPLWGGDVLWLADIALRETIVGSQDAILLKRLRRSSYAPANSREVVAFWIYMAWHLRRICARRIPRFSARVRATCFSMRYVYRLGIRRSNVLRTMWRVARMVSIAALTGTALILISPLRRVGHLLTKRPAEPENFDIAPPDVLAMPTDTGPPQSVPERRSA